MGDCKHEWYETALMGMACLNCVEKHDDVETLLNQKEGRIVELEAERDEILNLWLHDADPRETKWGKDNE